MGAFFRRKGSGRWMAAALALWFLFSAGATLGEGDLRGYDREEGYVYVTFGSYPQWMDGGDPENSDDTWAWASNKIADASGLEIEKSPILWRVLTVDDEKAYLCSEYVLFAMSIHGNANEYKTMGADFGQTDLCRYLNTVFIQDAFTETEQRMLLPCETYGKVFLLDAEDVNSKELGMGRNGNPGMKAQATEYAIRTDLAYTTWARAEAEAAGEAEAWEARYAATHDKAFAFVYKKQYGGHTCYWVRNQSTTDPRHGRCTKEKGTLGHLICDRLNEGVRPAVYLADGTWTIAGGEGTKEAPYQIVASAFATEEEDRVR